MTTIVAANESVIKVNNTELLGVRSLEYHYHQVRENIYALGSATRIGMVSGPQIVEGRLTVVSTSPPLNELAGDEPFSLTAILKHGETQVTVAFESCNLVSKSFNLGVGGFGEAEYRFIATSVRES